ncbi:MAG TPA: signal peptidase I [Acholeplasmataceae bacterium]|nr:signal peptidase I [Acholeplasmataceae bacterium]
MINKNNYLIRHYQKNNPLRDRLVINQKLFYKTMVFLLTSIIYFGLKAADTHQLFGRTNNFLSRYLSIIITVSLIISMIGLVITPIVLIKPKFLDKPFFKANYKHKKRLFNILDGISLIPICAVAAMFINIYIISVNEVSGQSMEPTYYDGDEVVMLHYKKPKRFDIVVVDVRPEYYNSLSSYQQLYIKRLIGMPGDKIELKKTHKFYVYINDVPYFEDYLPKDYFSEDYIGYVPEGHYFVMGDNRNNSYDSRRMGFVREEDIVGVVVGKKG